MFVYVGKQINVAHVGERIAGVDCEKCGCRYYYRLARVGVGSGTAPYFLGQAAASREAQQKSHRDLTRRLLVEAELVPCPRYAGSATSSFFGHRRFRQIPGPRNLCGRCRHRRLRCRAGLCDRFTLERTRKAMRQHHADPLVSHRTGDLHP